MRNTYIMSDIHGCYNEMLNMLDRINFSEDEQLILAGDYIDRGTQNYEMLRWIESAPNNILLLKGNHDVEFSYYIEIIKSVIKSNNLEIDNNDVKFTKIVYELTVKLTENNNIDFFDYYGTLKELILYHNITLEDLLKWQSIITNMPYFYKFKIYDKKCIVVHAGYMDNTAFCQTKKYPAIEDFYLYARDDAYIYGGIKDGIIISGHTPTLSKENVVYNRGNIYEKYNKDKNCIFYNIDCGCSYSKVNPDAKLACLRINDKEVFYI